MKKENKNWLYGFLQGLGIALLFVLVFWSVWYSLPKYTILAWDQEHTMFMVMESMKKPDCGCNCPIGELSCNGCEGNCMWTSERYCVCE